MAKPSASAPAAAQPETPPGAALPGTTRAFLAACFFVTGGTGLVYEVLWSRHLQLLFGSTTEAVSVVLAVFMTGLGAGAHVFGRRIDRSDNPMRIYAWCEIGIGAYALVTGPLLALVRVVYGFVAGRVELGVGATLLKAGLSALVLLLPAMLMGGTLPALVRAISDSRERARPFIPLLYGLNTLGAMAGTLAAGFFLLEVLGLSRTMAVSATLNLGVGGLVLVRSRTAPPNPARSTASLHLKATLGNLISVPGRREALAGLFVSGVTTMVYEIVFVRVLSLVFGVSSYAFSLVLAVFLAGLGLGSLICTLWARIRPPRLSDFALSQLATAAAATLALVLMPAVPRLVLFIRQIPDVDFTRDLLAKAGIATLFLLPIAVLSGLAVPVLIGALANDLKDLGQVIGAAYLVNTVGAVAGSLLTGFLLIPLVGTEGALRAALAANLLAGGIIAVRVAGSPGRRLASGVAAASLALMSVLPAHWPRALFTVSDVYPHPVRRSRIEIETRLAGSPQEILFFREGRNATVAVTQTSAGRSLLVGAHPDASDTGDMATQIFTGVVPLVAHPNPADVLVVGFGAGVTADAAARAPDTVHVDVAELERAVLEASPFFHHVNHAVEKNPKVRLVLDDARSYINATARRYDLILSEPSNPWRAGVANVFTVDFYRAARRVLRSEGIFAQWLQVYLMEFSSVRMILRSLHEVFPEMQVWWLDDGNFLILGADRPIRFSSVRAERLLGGVFLEDCRRHAGIGTAPEFFSRIVLGGEEVRKLIQRGTALHTDDLPLLEFEAPRDLFTADSGNTLRLLGLKLESGRLVPPLLDHPPADDVAWLGIATMYRLARRPAEAAEATRRALAARPTALACVRMTEVRLLENDVAGAEQLLTRSLSAEGAASPGVERERARAAARIDLARGRPASARSRLEASGQLDSESGVEVLQAFLERRDTEAALSLASRLLARAKPGGDLGSREVRGIYSLFEQASERGMDPVPFLPLVDERSEMRALPRNDLLRARAKLSAKAGRHDAAVLACQEAQAGGLIDLDLMLTELKSLRALRRNDRAADVERAILRLDPRALPQPVSSPLLPPRAPAEPRRGS